MVQKNNIIGNTFIWKRSWCELSLGILINMLDTEWMFLI